MERDALFWATELDRSNFGEYVWKRLRIIASEDCGIADPQAAVIIRALYDNWQDSERKDDTKHAPERLFPRPRRHAALPRRQIPQRRSRLVVMYEGPAPATRSARLRPRQTHRPRPREKSAAGNTGGKIGCQLGAGAPVDYEAEARAIRDDNQAELDLD
jgi:hypothetical protein